MRNELWPVAAATALLLVAGSAGAQERVAVNFNTHDRVELDRPVSVVWPLIVEPNSWKPNRQMVHYAGPAGKVGEVFAIGGGADRSKIWFLAENVELVPNQRRTIKLYDPAGRLLGFATWLLEPAGTRTILRYEVHAESLVPPEKVGAPGTKSVAEQEREGYEVNKKRNDDEFVILKRLLGSK